MKEKQSQQNINPNLRKASRLTYSTEACIEGFRNKNYKILSYLISKAESHLAVDRKELSEIFAHVPENNKFSKKIAISGPPGVGKSTFINTLADIYSSQGGSIAVLPIDPSSQVSKGSILGDKTRMSEISHKDNVFIKPMSSSLSMGGIAPATYTAGLLCERMGFDYILIETVGVGQSEYVVKNIVDCFVLLLQPGSGDELQGIKRGIMEMADILVVNKADGKYSDAARHTYDAYKSSLKLLLPGTKGWSARISKCSALTREGFQNVTENLASYFEFLSSENRYLILRKNQALLYFSNQSRSLILDHILKVHGIGEVLNLLRKQIENGDLSVIEALAKLEDLFKNDSKGE